MEKISAASQQITFDQCNPWKQPDAAEVLLSCPLIHAFPTTEFKICIFKMYQTYNVSCKVTATTYKSLAHGSHITTEKKSDIDPHFLQTAICLVWLHQIQQWFL